MGRKKGLWYPLLSIAILMAAFTNCHEKLSDDSRWIQINITSGVPASKAQMPDETKVTDINLLIFDSHGMILEHLYGIGGREFQVCLIKGESYTFAALANLGYRVNVKTLDELRDLDFHLAYPDEYKEGMPMYSEIQSHRISEQGAIELSLINMMSKISLRIDRNMLSDQVEMNVTGVRIGNCPKKTSIYKSNRIASEDECFSLGFSHRGQECSGLNTMKGIGLSQEVSVYMLENMQGAFNQDGIGDDNDKVLDSLDPRSKTCSYIELDMDYSSPLWQSGSTPLKYRFYLGEDKNNLDIERNCHYHITIIPQDDGLDGDSWRIDKSGLQYTGPTMLEQYPSDYIVGDIGDKIHLGCRLTPEHAQFDIGLEYLEDDKANGIYDYQIDPDGHGVTLTLTGPGCGLIYMEAGPPINDTALFLIEVNTPKH